MNKHIKDVAPVVRCKDCVHSLPNDGKLAETARYCTLSDCSTLGELAAVWDGDFCCNGKLRGDLQLIKDVLKKEKKDAQESKDSL